WIDRVAHIEPHPAHPVSESRRDAVPRDRCRKRRQRRTRYRIVRMRVACPNRRVLYKRPLHCKSRHYLVAPLQRNRILDSIRLQQPCGARVFPPPSGPPKDGGGRSPSRSSPSVPPASSAVLPATPVSRSPTAAACCPPARRTGSQAAHRLVRSPQTAHPH